MRFKRRRGMQEAVELNITAFLNLMVILVPFLLITAVFSRMTVLELNLPALNEKTNEQQSQEDEVELNLQVIVSKQSLILSDTNIGAIREFKFGGEGEEEKSKKALHKLSETLVEIKRRFPEKKSITLLLSKESSYKFMISLMDHVSQTKIVQATALETVELFPNISIGDAPDLLVEEPTALEGEK